MKLPKKIKVLSQDYEVTVMGAAEAAAKGRLGECDNNLKVIGIDTKWGDQQQAETLLHEILHAISHAMAIDANGLSCDEEIVHPMSNGLAAVMRDNPKTFKAIMEALG